MLRDMASCCPMHGQLQMMRIFVKRLARQPCNPMWSPFIGQQCEQCYCLNPEDCSECDICRGPLRITPVGVMGPVDNTKGRRSSKSHGIMLSPIVAHLVELGRHLNVKDIGEARDAISAAMTHITNSDVEMDVTASNWTCNYCGASN